MINRELLCVDRKKSKRTLVEGKNEIRYEKKKKRGGKTFKRKKLAIYIYTS